MNITQQDLDTLGVSSNPRLNTTLREAKAFIEFAAAFGLNIGELAINFQNSAGGPWPMPVLPIKDIQGAVIAPEKKYNFVAWLPTPSDLWHSIDVAYYDWLLSFKSIRPPHEVLETLAAELPTPVNIYETEQAKAIVRGAMLALAPKE